uniref:Uncharacterized protein n=1 Tax=Leersia perrieri TaxID=77586 RepID=A0A0D9UZ77_9ORYZ
MALALSTSAAARALAARLAQSTRGYAASAASAAMRRAAAAAEGNGAGRMVHGKDGSAGAAAAGEVSWVPDPVTGHYRPSNWAAAADAADLRAAHLARSYAHA